MHRRPPNAHALRWRNRLASSARLALHATLFVVLNTAPAVAQGAVRAALADSAGRPTPRAAVPWVTHTDLIVAAAFLGGTGALLPFDERITHAFRRPSVQRGRTLADAASVFRALGDPGVLAIGVGAYGIGRVVSSDAWTDLGWHTTEAIVVSGVVSGTVKALLGRARPYAVRDSNAADFAIGRGFRGGGAYQAMPSGHVTASFAAASVLSEEAWRRWPRRAVVLSAAAYGGATLVALSRIYHDAHWASDVVLAAGVGTVTGRVLVRAHHDAHWRGVDRWVLPSRVSRDAQGAWRVQWRIR